VVRLLCDLVLLYEAAIILRIVLSWFPLRPGGFPARANVVLVTLTDPVLAPLRRVLPRTGVIDLSPLVALLALEIVVRQLILRCS
jgi:YggT family protein